MVAHARSATLSLVESIVGGDVTENAMPKKTRKKTLKCLKMSSIKINYLFIGYDFQSDLFAPFIVHGVVELIAWNNNDNVWTNNNSILLRKFRWIFDWWHLGNLNVKLSNIFHFEMFSFWKWHNKTVENKYYFLCPLQKPREIETKIL